MVLVEWVEVNKFLIGGGLLLGALVVTFIARRRQWQKVLRYRLLSLSLGVLGVLVLCWGWMIVTSNDDMADVYSPNHRFAVRTSIGPFGAEAVELFSMHGLRKEVVYRGDASSLYWTDDSHLVVEYEHAGDYGEGRSCPGSRVVSVRCMPQPTH